MVPLVQINSVNINIPSNIFKVYGIAPLPLWFPSPRRLSDHPVAVVPLSALLPCFGANKDVALWEILLASLSVPALRFCLGKTGLRVGRSTSCGRLPLITPEPRHVTRTHPLPYSAPSNSA